MVKAMENNGKGHLSQLIAIYDSRFVLHNIHLVNLRLVANLTVKTHLASKMAH